MPTTSLRLERDSRGYWFSRWTDERGTRHTRRFGHDRRRAETDFAEFAAQWRVDPRTRTPDGADTLTLSGLFARFLDHADGYYRHADGTPTREATNYRHAIWHAEQMFGSTPASEFTAARLRLVQAAMVQARTRRGKKHEAGLSRTTINARVNKLRHVFRWAASVGLVDATIYAALTTVPALARGRTSAAEPEPVRPVDDEIVSQVITHSPRVLAAMIQVQRLTGMRPGELVIMRAVDIDASGPLWIYTPARHKLTHRGSNRAVPIGPRAQAILRDLMPRDLERCIFWQRADVARDRRRDQTSSGRRVGQRYTTASYYRAIQYACRRANVPAWHPNQLRHAWAAEARRNGAGLDAIQAQLGHSQARTTEGYARVNANASGQYLLRFG